MSMTKVKYQNKMVLQPKKEDYVAHPDGSGKLEFNLPKYGYAQYINDMSAWQKQLRDVNGEIGWFYFKIYFNFNTEYGLLGGLSRKDGIVNINMANSAAKYLKNISSGYDNCKINDRLIALYKFGNVLKHISLDVPWYFKGITGLSDIPYPYTNDFQKERKINIVCSEEAVDMRIGTLMDLYKYACFDNINCKEIIPRNLRKFEMTLVLMHVPLKFHHEPSIFVNGDGFVPNLKGKEVNLDTNDFSRLASFKMFTFQNCEFDLEQLGTYYGDQLSNENPFSLGKNQIQIKYDRVFEHRMNEWNEFLLGDDGFYYNNSLLSNLHHLDDETDEANDDWMINDLGLKNNVDDDSMHRQILKRIQSNHGNVKNKLISYSEYLINMIWENRYSGKWYELIDTFKGQTRNIRDTFNNTKGAFMNLSDTFNRFSNNENP